MLKVNNTNITEVLQGNNVINKIYKGAVLVYNKMRDTTPPVLKLYTKKNNKQVEPRILC